MVILKDLFSTDIGLLSVATIAFMIFMGFYFVAFVRRKMQEDSSAK